MKWKTYKALLTQTGENAPIARVLNQDEDDYLGDIVWTRSDVGVFKGESENININLTEVLFGELNTDNTSIYYTNSVILQGEIYISTYNNQFLNSDGIGDNFPIEIKVRQRGAPPKLLSAETNETGDKIILTFDKKMSYQIYENVYSSFIQKINGVEDGAVSCTEFPNENIITINPSTQIEYGQNIELSYMLNIIESFDYGLLQPFENFPVVNNVIAPL